jgi:hypothetical protein
MKRKAIAGLVALTVLVSASLAMAVQVDNGYVYAVQKELNKNYDPFEMLRWHERDVIQAVEKLGYRAPTPPEAEKLLCLVGALSMPHRSSFLTEDPLPAPTSKPQPPEITLGKVDGSNAFDLIWQNEGGLVDSAEYAISDIATTGPGDDLDNDGKPEIVVTCKRVGDNSIAKVVVFEQADNDSFAQVWYHDFNADYAKADTAHNRATRVELGDLDGDGDLDIICGVYCRVTAKTDFGCVRVFAWDGVNGSDNYGTDPATTWNMGITGTAWATAMAVGNIDEDADLELVVSDNTSNRTFVGSITGTLGGAVTWNLEYDNGITQGSPYAATVGDCDNDSQMEFYVTYWDSLKVYTYEWDAAGDSIIPYGSTRLSPGDDFSWDGTVVANLDGNAYSEVYVTSTYYGYIWVLTNTGDVSTATPHLLDNLDYATEGARVGDQDHGAGSDGGDLYVGIGGGKVYDYEFTGTYVESLSSYTRYVIFDDPTVGDVLMVAVMDSLDLDGEHEVVVGGAESSQNPSLFVLEHGEFRAHDVGVQSISPDFTTVGQSNITAVIKNYGANNESGIDVYWSTDTGDNGSEGPLSINSQEGDTISLGWTADTTGLVDMTVWTVLAGDENAANDTLSGSIFVYPPETGQYTYTYFRETAYRTRGIGVFGNDDFVVGHRGGTSYPMQFFHNAPNDADVSVYQWINPSDPGDTIRVTYNWGIGLDQDLHVYLANQDSAQNVLVFNYDGTSTSHRLELGPEPTGVEYPTACDIDDSGRVYIAFYIGNPTGGDQVVVYDKLSTWNDVNHTAPLLTSFEPPAYVCEGLCVNGDGTIIWLTNRSAPPFLGDVTRWTGSPTGGYTQDMAFAGDGTLNIPAWVRGIDLAPDGDIYICSDGDASYAEEKIIIADATTGELKYTIDIDAPGGYHQDPYDIGFSLVGEIASLTAQKAGDDVHLSWSTPGAATAMYVTQLYGWYVDKWEGPGFKGVTSYDVHRDTVPEFIPVPATLLDNTANTFYTDTTAAVGNTGLNHYYIVKSKGTPGYAGARTAVSGEFDKDLAATKKKATEDRTTAQRMTR